MPVFALILIWPLVEIALFVTLGSWLGLGLTLAEVVGSAALGIFILRGQGATMAGRLRGGLAGWQRPLAAMGSDALRLMAGVLLILPGFLTDALGLILMVPQVRAVLVLALARRFGPVAPSGPIHDAGGVIEGEFTELPPDRTQPPSGWTRH